MFSRWTFTNTGRSRRMCRPCRWVGSNGGEFLFLTGNCRIHLTWIPRLGIGGTALAIWREHPRRGFQMRVERGTTWMKKKKVKADVEKAVHSAALESTVLSALHALVAHAAVTRYEDGDPRVPGWWTVTTQGANWKVTVKDPDSCSSFVVIAPTIDEGLQMASLLLEADEAPWEHDKWLQKGQKKK